MVNEYYYVLLFLVLQEHFPENRDRRGGNRDCVIFVDYRNRVLVISWQSSHSLAHAQVISHVHVSHLSSDHHLVLG